MRLLATQDGLPRVSWGGVIAGVILSSITYLILSVLGAAIGSSTLSPLSRLNSPQGFGLATGAYLIVMTAIAVFVGSYFAGRLAPVLGWLHGLLAWAVMVLVIGYGATSLLGGAVSAAGSVASTGAMVGASANPSADAGAMTGPLTQQVQGAIASATAVASSSPQAEADAREAAHTAARGIARASWFSFAALMVGAIIAVLSGHAGYRRQPPFAEARGASSDDVVRSRDAEHHRVLPTEPSV
jgi:MFS family permease